MHGVLDSQSVRPGLTLWTEVCLSILSGSASKMLLNYEIWHWIMNNEHFAGSLPYSDWPQFWAITLPLLYNLQDGQTRFEHFIFNHSPISNSDFIVNLCTSY